MGDDTEPVFPVPDLEPVDFLEIPAFFALMPTAAKFVSLTIPLAGAGPGALPKDAKKSSSSIISFRPLLGFEVVTFAAAAGGIYAGVDTV